MNLSRIRIQNVRLFDELDVKCLNEQGERIPFTLIVGNNASGKSTLLRSVAIGLCDESSAAGLVRELKGSLIRQEQNRAQIDVEVMSQNGNYWTIRTELEKKVTGDAVRQKVFASSLDDLNASLKNPKESQQFPWNELFVAAYGAGRNVDGSEQYSQYRPIDALYSLFRYDTPLQNPELAWRRQRDLLRKPKTDSWIAKLLQSVLLLPRGNRVVLTKRGIEFRTPHGTVPLSDHGDGYRSTTTWLLDLTAWWLLYQDRAADENIAGIVFVDEVEQHLHPRWQRYVISRLHQQLPQIQFVVTTHSPLCVASSADLTDDECHLIELENSEVGNVARARDLSLPRGLRADQILTSEAFDLGDTRNPELGEQVERFHKLFQKDRRSSKEQREFVSLKVHLNEVLPESVQFADEAKIRDELRELVEKAEGLHHEKEGK